MLRRYSNDLKHEHILVSDSETESDDIGHHFNTQTRKRKNIEEKSKENELRDKCERSRNKNDRNTFEEEKRSDTMKASKGEPDAVIKSNAEKYQEYMKQIPLPSANGSAIPFVTWQDLAKSMSQLYGQPLHYLTHNLLKQWDESRAGSADEKKPMDSIVHATRAEATIWGIEEFHRRCCSHRHLAKLWHSDPMYHEFFNQINRPIMSKLG